MTKHETLIHLLKAAARAVHLSEEVTTEQGDGMWNNEPQPSLYWSGIWFDPADVEYEASSILGKKIVPCQGWRLSYEHYYSGTQWEPPEVENVAFLDALSEQQAASAAVIFVVTDGINNAVMDAAESLHWEEERNAEKAT